MAPTSTTTSSTRGLEGVRVLEFPDPKTALCGRLLAETGADIVLIEPPGGAQFRSMPPTTGETDQGLYFWYTNVNKRSATLDLNQEHDRIAFLSLVERADVILDPFPPGYLAALGLSDETLFAANRNLVLLSLTGFGQTGPFRDYASSDIVGMAMGGMMSLTGDPSREPLTPPAWQCYQVSSLWATIAVQAAVYRRIKTGQGARIDMSLQEAAFDMSETAHTFYLCNGDIVKRNSRDHPLACPFRVYNSKDGFAFIGLSSQGQWFALLDWMKEKGLEPEHLQDPDLGNLVPRLARRTEVNEAVGKFAELVSHEELFAEGAKRGLPNAPVRPVKDVLDDEHLQARDFFDTIPDPRKGKDGVRHRSAGLPFRGKAGPRRQTATPPPKAGENSVLEISVSWSSPGREWPTPTEPVRETLLGGVNVVELCWNIAGPTMGRVLTDLGASTIKVEPRGVGEPGRMIVPFPDRTPDINKSYTFHDNNRGKLGITIDMKNPKGPGLATKLAGWADVMLENFTAGTMERLNIPYETLSTANSKLVLGSLCGFGQTGPRATWPSYHPTSASLCGLNDLFAYEGGEPLGFGNSYMDFTTGYMGAIGVLDGLLRRELTGLGDQIDIPQLETGIFLVGTQLLEWTVNGHQAEGEGNRWGAFGAPLQGCYQCQGDDQWIVVTVQDDQALEGLAMLTNVSSNTSQNDLNETLSRWARDRDPWEAFHELQRAGIAAGVVSHGSDLVERDKHMQARGAIAKVSGPEVEEISLAQCPVIVDGKRLAVESPGALLGQHNEQVLRETLGLSEEDYLQFVVEDVI